MRTGTRWTTLATIWLALGALAAQACGSDGEGGVQVPDVDGGEDAMALLDGTAADGGSGSDAAGNADAPDPFAFPDGSVILPDGGILLPDGGVISIPDGGVLLADGGGILLPDGGVIPITDGGQVGVVDGGISAPDGGIVVILPDGGRCVQATCQGKLYACGDCIDNDGDGKTDMDDVGCLGPCDNTETDLTLGIPGGNNAPCKADCYFDQDTGSGNDKCVWDHGCDPHETSPNFYPETQSGAQCKYDWEKTKVQGNGTCSEFFYSPGQPNECHNFCGPLTPNGCDCFGCCTFPALANEVEAVQPPLADGGVRPAAKPKYVWLGSLDTNGNPSCTADKVNDPTKCHSCTPVQSCLNTCERCELCIGKTTLPADCLPPPPPPVIPDGGIPLPDGGGTLLPDGGVLLPDGGVISIPDGGLSLPDGGLILPDGGIVQSDGGSFPAGDGGTCGGQLCFSGAACGLACQAPCPTGQFCLTGCCTPNPK